MNVAVAVNCWVVPAGIVALAGVTAIELVTAGVTVTEVEPVIEPEVRVVGVPQYGRERLSASVGERTYRRELQSCA